MPRLTPDQWEQARAEYEVRALSLGAIAKKFGVDVSAVSRRAKKEQWTQGKSQGLVNQKAAAIKSLAQVESQSQRLPLTFQMTLDDAVKEKLASEGILASLSNAIASRAHAMVSAAETPEDLETLSRIKKNLTPTSAPSVNITQQQASLASPQLSPAEVMSQLAEAEAEAEREP